MTKRGRPFKSQPTQSEASKQRRVDFDEAMDDVIPIALAQNLRHKLAEYKPKTSTSNEAAEAMKPRVKKADHLYCRRTTTEFMNALQSLTPRQKEAVNELGFGAILDFKIKEIPGQLAYWILANFDLPKCQIPLSGGEKLTLEEEDVHLTLGFPRCPTPITRPTEKQSNFEFNDYAAVRCKKADSR